MARSHRRMRSASLTTLPVIVEDETAIQPPPYTEQDGNWDDRHSTATESETAPTLVEKPETSRLPGWLHSRIGKRGGWKRFILIVAILFVLLTALGVGLGVGLSKARSQ